MGYCAKSAFHGFLWAACFTLTASQWLVSDPVNFVVIFPALVLVFSPVERWRGGG